MYYVLPFLSIENFVAAISPYIYTSADISSIEEKKYGALLYIISSHINSIGCITFWRNINEQNHFCMMRGSGEISATRESRDFMQRQNPHHKYV